MDLMNVKKKSACVCSGKTAKGEQCKRKVLADSGYCKSHIPQSSDTYQKIEESTLLTKEESKQEDTTILTKGDSSTDKILLPRKKSSSIESSTEFEDCPVCTDPLTKKDVLVLCKHRIHMDCIIKSGKKECPICRSDVKLTATQQLKLERVGRKYEKERIRAETQHLRELNRGGSEYNGGPSSPPVAIHHRFHWEDLDLPNGARIGVIRNEDYPEDSIFVFPPDYIGELPPDNLRMDVGEGNHLYPHANDEFMLNLAILENLIESVVGSRSIPSA